MSLRGGAPSLEAISLLFLRKLAWSRYASRYRSKLLDQRDLATTNISDKIIIDEIPVLWNNSRTARIPCERDGPNSRLPNSRHIVRG
jgi:hypothetical protein